MEVSHWFKDQIYDQKVEFWWNREKGKISKNWNCLLANDQNYGIIFGQFFIKVCIYLPRIWPYLHDNIKCQVVAIAFQIGRWMLNVLVRTKKKEIVKISQEQDVFNKILLSLLSVDWGWFSITVYSYLTFNRINVTQRKILQEFKQGQNRGIDIDRLGK